MPEFLEEPYESEEIDEVLHPIVKEWFYSKFEEYSLPQKYGVMEIHKRKNLLVSAPTGATKTLTGFLSILNELVTRADNDTLEDKTYAIYQSPLKALNYDIRHNLKEPLEEMEEIAGEDLGIRIGVRTGDTTDKEKREMRKNAPHILITTPESLGILLNTKKFVEHLKEVEWCIIDEIHSLAQNKRGVHLSLSMERLERLTDHLTRIGLSATVAPLDEVAEYLSGYEDGEPRDCGIVDVQFIKDTDFKVLSPVDDMMNTNKQVSQNRMYDQINDLVQDHDSTLIFTNTRSATERVVHNLKERYPDEYEGENVGAHHSSLGKDHREEVENKLRNGEMKVVSCSTSLEMGLDIGYIDLVICLGSPKSVARFLQRAGRAGHQLDDTVKGRIIVMDRDDLVECSLLLKSALEEDIDRIHIPTNCLDVLAQKIFGISIQQNIGEQELYDLIKQSYCYKDLDHSDYIELLKYLSGEYASLEDQHVYAKIWWDKEEGMLGSRGKMARPIYMTNIGTIPDESFVRVKIAGTDKQVGKIDEWFLEKLKKGDVFVLGGDVYEFKYSKGMTAFASASVDRPPTVPRWVSQTLPLSFDLAMDISKFRRLMKQKFDKDMSKDKVLDFIDDYLYVGDNAKQSIYQYFWEQYNFSKIPNDKKIVVEHYTDEEEDRKYAIFHTLFGRRVNDCLSRAIAYVIGKQQDRDVEIGVNDNGFYVAHEKRVNAMKAFKALKPDKLKDILKKAIRKSEMLKRRFRHCACRSLMILRNYKGHKKKVGRQQMSSQILLSAVRRIDEDFPVLKEARREVLEDLMDYNNTKSILEKISNEEISVEETYDRTPSPFAFGLVSQGYSDVIKIESKYQFLKRMHNQVLTKIGKEKDISDEVDIEDLQTENS